MKLRKAKKRKVVYMIIVCLLLIAFLVAALWQGIRVRSYTVLSDKVSDTVRIVQISDLHDTRYGKNQKNLIKKIDEQFPDVIVLTGDIAVDDLSHKPTEELLSQIVKEYPCYYVSGNHEYQSGEPQNIKEMISSYGVKILEGETVFADINGQKISISGVDDPMCFGLHNWRETNESNELWYGQLKSCDEDIDNNTFSLLLTHRPELVEAYQNTDFDLVLSGHAHGGQVRIPLIMNGLLAPNQGFFPKYAGGEYELDGTKMIVSRGLCRNFFPRVFNPPELVVIDIKPNS